MIATVVLMSLDSVGKVGIPHLGCGEVEWIGGVDGFADGLCVAGFTGSGSAGYEIYCGAHCRWLCLESMVCDCIVWVPATCYYDLTAKYDT